MVDRVMCLLSNIQEIVKILDSFQQGSVILQHGSNVIEVVTRKPPVDVWLSIHEGNMPVCHGDITKVGYSVTKNGFILYADVASNTAQINWYTSFAL